MAKQDSQKDESRQGKEPQHHDEANHPRMGAGIPGLTRKTRQTPSIVATPPAIILQQTARLSATSLRGRHHIAKPYARHRWLPKRGRNANVPYYRRIAPHAGRKMRVPGNKAGVPVFMPHRLAPLRHRQTDMGRSPQAWRIHAHHLPAKENRRPGIHRHHAASHRPHRRARQPRIRRFRFRRHPFAIVDKLSHPRMGVTRRRRQIHLVPLWKT